MFEKLIKDLRAHGYQWMLNALVTVFGLQILRVLFVSFVGYLRDSLGMASLTLAPIAIGVFENGKMDMRTGCVTGHAYLTNFLSFIYINSPFFIIDE